jgi:glutamine cyclotransferase
MRPDRARTFQTRSQLFYVHVNLSEVRLLAFLIVVALSAIQAGDQHLSKIPPAPRYGFRIIHVFPHDPSAYTEGLLYRDGFLYESTGLAGKSRLRKVDPDTGKVLLETTLDARYFGEGITLFNKRIIQLTWQSHQGFVYDSETFGQLRTFAYPGEGWGLTNNRTQIFMSDGTPEIRCLDPETLTETRRIKVHDGSHLVGNLNELEYIRGEIFANVWLVNKIVRISPDDGHVTGWIDLEGLVAKRELPNDREAVLNGIAWDPDGSRLFVTGKMWSKLFEIELVQSGGGSQDRDAL